MRFGMYSSTSSSSRSFSSPFSSSARANGSAALSFFCTLSLHSLSLSLSLSLSKEGRKDNLPLQRKSKKCPLPYTLNLKDETLKNGRKKKEKNNASKTS